MLGAQKDEKTRRGELSQCHGKKVGEDSLEILDSFRYLGDMISCGPLVYQFTC